MAGRRRREAVRHRFLVVLAAGVALAACGPGDTPEAVPAAGGAAATGSSTDAGGADGDGTAAGSTPSGCLVVSADAVAAATGMTVLDEEESLGGCRWQVEPVEETVPDAAISWQPLSLANFEDPRETDPSGESVTDVDDLGDDAYVLRDDSGDHPIGLVFVRVGEQAFRVANEFATARTPGTIEVQQALAALIAESLR